MRISQPFGRVAASRSFILMPGSQRTMPGFCHSIFGHVGEVEQHAAFERHRLAVIAGRGAARGQRDAQLARRRQRRAITSASSRGVATTSADLPCSCLLRTGEYQK